MNVRSPGRLFSSAVAGTFAAGICVYTVNFVNIIHFGALSAGVPLIVLPG